jgi:predicted AlkP superfamily pyrophosphatase or phosphodiesterase
MTRIAGSPAGEDAHYHHAMPCLSHAGGHARRLRVAALATTLLALVALAACSTAPSRAPAPPPAHAPAPAFAPAVLLVSIDGLRADVVGSGVMPTLDAMAARGVHADWMNPSYPSLTFPNHYTLVTGLRPDRHGIVNNTMRDPVLGPFSLGNRQAVEDAHWWGGTPVWATLQAHGGHAATMFWPGSEAPIGGTHPEQWRRFDASTPNDERVDTVLDWLSRTDPARPTFVTLYFDQVDHEEHASGPASPPSMQAEADVDAALARLLAGLDARGLRDSVDVVVVSDHGMARVPAGQREYLDDLLAAKKLPVGAVDAVSRGTSVGLDVAPGADAKRVERALLGRHAHSECWRKAEVPARWHYGTNPRVPAIVCQADVGWILTTRPAPGANARARDDDAHATGAHGFAPESPEMRAVFVADGPRFADGKRLPPFDNVDVYPLLMRLLGVPAEPNDGDPETLLPALEPGR